MDEKKPLIERIVEVLRKHGPCTLAQLAERAETSVATLYTMTGTLKKLHGVVRHKEGSGAATYGFDRGKPVRMAQRPVEAAREAAKPNGTNGHAAFAINEEGELGITKDGSKLTLDGAEFERLRGFIERTEPVWKGE